MRTTLTLDPDLAKKIKELAHIKQTSFKAMLNEVLRRGLGPGSELDECEVFAVKPHRGGFKPGIDLGKLNQLADQLEVDHFSDRHDHS